MTQFNSLVVIPMLKDVVTFLEKNNIEYRFLGSVVMAAINGKLHRNLGDLDLIIDTTGKDLLYNELTNNGYKPAKGMFSFARRYLALETLDHPDSLGVGFFYGKWQSDGSFTMGKKNINVKIDSHAVEPTRYELYGVKFTGLPQEVIATGVQTSSKNPKRRYELEILKEKQIKPLPNTYIHVKVLGRRFDWIYHLSMALLNIIGGIRVKLGLAFDPWR